MTTFFDFHVHTLQHSFVSPYSYIYIYSFNCNFSADITTLRLFEHIFMSTSAPSTPQNTLKYATYIYVYAYVHDVW